MSTISTPKINAFLDDIAEATGYPREELSFVAELRGHGSPTVGPGAASDSALVKRVVAGEDTMPNLWYDTLGSHHVDFKVIRTVGSEKTKIPTPLFSFQHAVFFGNCKICIHRWVRVHDSTWGDELRKRAFAFRKDVARAAGVQTLVVSTGKSFSGDEYYDEFEKSYGNSTHSIYALHLAEAA